MKKLFVVIVTDVEGVEYSSLYYIKAASEIDAEEKARELAEDFVSYDGEELDEMVSFDVREFQESDIIEA
jgi:hypothetical protein